MKTEHNINRVFIYTLMTSLFLIFCFTSIADARTKWSKDQHHQFFEHLYDEGVVKNSTEKMNYTFFISCVGSFYSQKYSYDEWYKLFTAKETTKQQILKTTIVPQLVIKDLHQVLLPRIILLDLKLQIVFGNVIDLFTPSATGNY